MPSLFKKESHKFILAIHSTNNYFGFAYRTTDKKQFDEELDRGLDLSKYETSITDPRSHFHIHYFNRSNDYMEKKVLDSYNINVNFPVIFFSREIPHRDGFRCAFHLQTLKKLRSPFLRDVVKIIKMFKGNFIDIILAADFTKNGEICNKDINIEEHKI